MSKANIIKFLETLSVVGFGLAYWKYDLNAATLTLMTLMTVFVIAVKLMGEKLTKLQFFSWLVVVTLGGAGVLFRDETFIKWKTTVINGGLGVIFLASQWVGDKTLMERLIGDKIKAPAAKLKRLNFATSLYFFFISILNLVVAYYFSTTLWVKFKIFGLLMLNFLFVIAALFYLRDWVKDFFDSELKKQ